MTIEPNMVITLSYKLSNHQSGEHIETTPADRPMEYLYGIEQMIPAFDAQLLGKKEGEFFLFHIASAEAFGEHSEEDIVMIPIHVFQDEEGKINQEQIFEGAIVPMTDNEGNRMRGRVLAITPEAVKMDFNHPLAGIDLLFEGQILGVRAATPDEISHGHSHGAHGHHH